MMYPKKPRPMSRPHPPMPSLGKTSIPTVEEWRAKLRSANAYTAGSDADCQDLVEPRAM